LKNCSDSIKDVDQIGQLIEDIWNIRVAKLRLAVQTVEKNRVETEMPDHGGLYEVSDYTQLGKLVFPRASRCFLWLGYLRGP